VFGVFPIILNQRKRNNAGIVMVRETAMHVEDTEEAVGTKEEREEIVGGYHVASTYV
jgi:hypothetical protein